MKKPKKRVPSKEFVDQVAVFEYLRSRAPAPSSFAQISKHLGLRGKREHSLLQDILDTAISHQKLACLSSHQYTPLEVEGASSYEGVIDRVRSSLAYVRSPQLDPEPTLEGQQLAELFHGDRVRVGLLPSTDSHSPPKAYLIEVLSRSELNWVGHLKPLGKDFSFHSDSPRLHKSLIVLQKDAEGATLEDKVIVEPLFDRSEPHSHGKVSHILGKVGTHEVEMHSILQTFDVPNRFSQDVLRQVQQMGPPSADEIQKRKDFRSTCCFTIDPPDAKDFDDALSFRKLPEGLIEIGIHIADVSYYVQPQTPLDEAAQQRGTSIYLVDRTVPMLPDRLSNDLCSLRPKEERLAFSALFTMDQQARIQKRWFGKSVIRSQRRFTYDEALRYLLPELPPQIPTEDKPCLEALSQLNQLAQQLRKRRFEAGAMRLHSLEFNFTLDAEGQPLSIQPKAQHQAHELIEECMLLANQEVSDYIHREHAQSSQPLFVYRVHEPPQREKLETFALFAKKFGHQLNWKQNQIPHQINDLLEKVKGKAEEPLLQQLAIRSMSKARYTTDPIPHFGLGFTRYTHFTSPIRRYPDLLVHRLLLSYLQKKTPTDHPPHEALCAQTSLLERRAIEVERASIKYKQAEYMLQHIGKTFTGIVSGITEWGFFVSLQPSYCEGMIRLSSLKHDYYTYNPQQLSLQGRHSGHTINLGDELQVSVLAANPLQRQIDLAWIPPPQRARASRHRSRSDRSRQRRTR